MTDATSRMADRYIAIAQDHIARHGSSEIVPLTGPAHLAWMCEQIKDTSLPLDKRSRWLGFVQGCMAVQGLIDVNAERDHSRPLFHAEYQANGTPVPETIEREPVIRYFSDGHLEGQRAIHWEKYPADILVIAGDLTDSFGDTAKALRKIAKHYPHVVFVEGNHEHFANAARRRSMTEARTVLLNLLPANVVYLHPGNPVARVGGVRFVGATGWYFVDDQKHWKSAMNDHRYIDYRGSFEPGALAVDDAETILRNLSEDEKSVVITHMPPSVECMEGWRPKQHGTFYDRAEYERYYFNPLMEFVMKEHVYRIAFWIHGHVHHPVSKNIGGVEVRSNPREYRGENPNWIPEILK